MLVFSEAGGLMLIGVLMHARKLYERDQMRAMLKYGWYLGVHRVSSTNLQGVTPLGNATLLLYNLEKHAGNCSSCVEGWPERIGL